MANDSVLKKIMGFHPAFEMIVRRIYRSQFLGKFINKKQKQKLNTTPLNISFDKIVEYLRKLGISKGDILIVHSAYGSLKGSRLSPNEIIDKLIAIVGEDGTLAMPVIRKFSESPDEKEALTASIEEIIFTYDVQNTPIWTGVLPKTLMNRDGAVTSRFPLNTLTAMGKHAEIMMQNNLDGELPAPNGINYPWKYCTDHDAWVVSLGTDLTHSLTMIHTAEDVKKENWPIKGWYRKKRFKIQDGDFYCEKTILERHPKWGMLHFGERKLSSDLIKSGVLKSNVIDGVLIESLKSKDLFNFLNSRNSNGYPYFWVKKYLK